MFRGRGRQMECLYRLKYWRGDLEGGKNSPKYIEARAIQYGTSDAGPMEQRYFYGVEEGPPEKYICFIKRFGADKTRYKLEGSAARISSPYVASPYSPLRTKRCRMEYFDNGSWRPMEGNILLYEYLPSDLIAFQKRYIDREEMPDAYRRDILLKLIQGVGHIHQARIIHHDIKPGNILINCQGLCEKAPWNHQELDVRLTDFDGMYDENCGVPQSNVGTEPFQPQHRIPPSVWLDIYSMCMVALWLYDSREEYLIDINQRLPKTKEEIEKIMEDNCVVVPERIKQVLVPRLLRAISKMTSRLDESQWEAGAKELFDFYQELGGVFMDGWQPIELLGPVLTSTAWSAVVQLDQELWPVYGQDREYRVLPMMTCRSGQSSRNHQFCGAFDGGFLKSCGSSGYGSITNSVESSGLDFSALPVIFVAGEQNGGVWSLKAGIYESINPQGTCLPQKKHLSEGENVELYRISGDRAVQNIVIHSIRFYSEKEGPTALPVFRGPVRNEMADINLIFVMMVSGSANGSGDLGRRLICRVTDEVSKIAECNICCYGITIRKGDENMRSFCGGMRNPSGNDLSKLYVNSTSTGRNRDSPSRHGMRDTEGGDTFDAGLPTIVIGYLDHPLDWDTDIVQHFKEGLSLRFRYAVQYLQLFTTNRLDLTADMRRLSPYLAAAVEPDGACILMPLSEGDGFPDPNNRWLTAVHYWRQRGATKFRGGKLAR